MTLLRDDRWPVARLIPITSSTGVEARERNAASALLAVLAHVDEFGRALLKTFYGEVLQQLTAWKPRAPKLRSAEGPIERETADVPPPIEEALERAEDAMVTTADA